MDYKVNLMQSAEEDLESFVEYLLFEKKSEQAARNLPDDFERTKESLSHMAGSLKICENQGLKELGYRRINSYHIDTLCYTELRGTMFLSTVFFMNLRIMRIR